VSSVSISQLKTYLGRYLRAVRRGEEIVVTDRGRPVARIVPLEKDVEEKDGLDALVQEGIVRPRAKAKGRLKPPPGKGSSGVLTALLQERQEGR